MSCWKINEKEILSLIVSCFDIQYTEEEAIAYAEEYYIENGYYAENDEE